MGPVETMTAVTPEFWNLRQKNSRSPEITLPAAKTDSEKSGRASHQFHEHNPHVIITGAGKLRILLQLPEYRPMEHCGNWTWRRIGTDGREQYGYANTPRKPM